MGVVVMKKPEERVRRGWREKTRTTEETRKGVSERELRALREKEKEKRKARDAQGAHNSFLLRVRGIEAPKTKAAPGSAGIIAKVSSALSSLLGGKKIKKA